MLTAGILNGFVIWIKSIIDWIKRVWYALHGAVIVPGVCEKANISSGKSAIISETFRVSYEGTGSSVKVSGPPQQFESLPADEATDLLWIPGKNKAMLTRYKGDEKSRKTLLVCDVASLAGLAALIGGYAWMFSFLKNSEKLGQTQMILIELLIVGGIALMIIMSIIRKKLKK